MTINKVIIRKDGYGGHVCKVKGFKFEIKYEDIEQTDRKYYIIKNNPNAPFHTMGRRYLAKKASSMEEVREYLKNI